VPLLVRQKHREARGSPMLPAYEMLCGMLCVLMQRKM
jgi:hypothetical protein